MEVVGEILVAINKREDDWRKEIRVEMDRRLKAMRD